MARVRKAQEDHFNAGIRLLECLVKWPSSRGVTQLAHEVGLAPSSTHDLLKILCDLGFAQQDPDTRRYAPSPRMFEFINFFTINFGITPKIQELLQKRSIELGLSIFLGTVWQNESYVVCTSGPLGGVSAIGSHGSILITSIGKAILAEGTREDWEEAADLIDSIKIPKHSQRPKREDFLREIECIAQCKTAWNIFGTERNILSVAAAINAGDQSRKYAVALVFTREMYYLVDRSKMESTVKDVAKLIEDGISVKPL